MPSHTNEVGGTLNSLTDRMYREYSTSLLIGGGQLGSIFMKDGMTH